MSRVPLPRFSNLSTLGTNAKEGASGPNPPGIGNAPTNWEGLYDSSLELKKIRDSIFPILSTNKQGFVSLNIRPALYEIQKELERTAVQHFGLLGRLCLMKPTKEECGTELLPLPAMVLAFAVHSAILNAGFVCTGSANVDFSEQEAWPNCLPPQWLDDTGSKYSFRYRLRSGASDRLIWKAVVMTDLLAISANDPYSSGKDAMTMHLRIKDFVKSKAGEPPALQEAKERELVSVIEERILPLGMTKRGSNLSSDDGMYIGGGGGAGGGYGGGASGPYITGGGGPAGGGPGFGGDLVPGGGGSMLFGPGNAQFDQRFRPGQAGQGGRGGGRIPEARYDPYGPFGTGNFADPDPDEFPMPGPRNPMGNFPSGPTGPRRSNLDYL